MSLAALLAVASCCRAGAAPDAVWSKPANGLRCRLEPDQREVPQGAEAIFHLHLYRAPSIAMTVVPKAWKGEPRRPAEF